MRRASVTTSSTRQGNGSTGTTNRRLLSQLDYIPPHEYATNYYAHSRGPSRRRFKHEAVELVEGNQIEPIVEIDMSRSGNTCAINSLCWVVASGKTTQLERVVNEIALDENHPASGCDALIASQVLRSDPFVILTAGQSHGPRSGVRQLYVR